MLNISTLAVLDQRFAWAFQSRAGSPRLAGRARHDPRTSFGERPTDPYEGVLKPRQAKRRMSLRDLSCNQL